MITLGILNELNDVRHGFFTREGGVSDGLYASLNVSFGSEDDPARVAENRRRAMRMLDLPAESLVTAYQVHGRDVAVVDKPWRREDAPRVDALVTGEPDIAVAILTADCVPVVIADPKAHIVAAVHAGWKGARAGIIAAAVERMVQLGANASDMVAGIGPCIAKRSYEVGPEFPRLILGRDLDRRWIESNEAGEHELFAPARRPGHYLFDLSGYVLRRLADAGVPKLDRVPADTFGEEERFFSYRRATVRGEHDYGRSLTAIALAR